jgi:hypothetical protein
MFTGIFPRVLTTAKELAAAERDVASLTKREYP